MKAVGELVGFRSDEAGLGLVYGPVEHFFRHTLQLTGKMRLQIGEDGMYKGRASADDVFVEPALAFMDAHGYAAGEQGVVVAVVTAQLVEGVTALVNHRIHGAGQVVSKIVGGDAHIPVIEIGGKGMLRFPDAAVGPVQPHERHQVVREFPLLLHRVNPVQEAVVNLGDTPDFFNQRHDGTPEPGEEFVQGFHIHALFVLVQQGVIGGKVRVIVAREFPVEFHNLFQDGAEGGKIVFRFCLVPDGVGFIEQYVVANEFLGGDPLHPVVFLPGLLQLPLLKIGQFLQVGLKKVKQRTVFFAHGQIVDNAAEHFHGLAPALPGAFRRRGDGIQTENAHGVTVGA